MKHKLCFLFVLQQFGGCRILPGYIVLTLLHCRCSKRRQPKFRRGYIHNNFFFIVTFTFRVLNFELVRQKFLVFHGRVPHDTFPPILYHILPPVQEGKVHKKVPVFLCKTANGKAHRGAPFGVFFIKDRTLPLSGGCRCFLTSCYGTHSLQSARLYIRHLQRNLFPPYKSYSAYL